MVAVVVGVVVMGKIDGCQCLKVQVFLATGKGRAK